MFIVILFFSIYTYVLEYSPLKKDRDSLNFEIALLEASIEQYKLVDSEYVMEENLWENDFETDTIDFSTYPVDIREQDQITFYIAIEDLSYVQVSGLTMSTGDDLGSTGKYLVSSRRMSFQYIVDSYDEFSDFFQYLKNNGEYPSSITTFSMEVKDDGSVSGTMNIENYYITGENLERGYKIPSEVIIGGVRLFENE